MKKILCFVCHVLPKRCWDAPCVLSHLQHPWAISYPVVHHVWTTDPEHTERLIRAWCSSVPILLYRGRKGKGKKQYKKWASFSDARWAKTKSCCNSLSTNIFLLSMAWEKKMTFYKSNWFSLSNNRPAENCFEGRSYPEQQLQTELDLLWDWTTASVGSFSLPIARLCALPLYFAVLAVSAISESVAPHCIIKIVVPSFSMLIQRLPGARRNTTWRVFLSTKRQMKRLWEVRCHKIIRQRWDHCRGYLNSDE